MSSHNGNIAMAKATREPPSVGSDRGVSQKPSLPGQDHAQRRHAPGQAMSISVLTPGPANGNGIDSRP